MDAAQALADLTEISSQIRSAVIVDGEGSLVASTFDDDDRARRVAEKARALLAAAEEVPGGSGRSLAQLEAATLEGSIFVVRDGDRAIAATTSPEPTVGLVFYDLKSCLRGAAGEEKPKPRAKRKPAAKKEEDGAEA